LKSDLKLLKLILFFFVYYTVNSQCGVEQDIIICDMATIDYDGDSKPDGIINLYDEYKKI